MYTFTKFIYYTEQRIHAEVVTHPLIAPYQLHMRAQSLSENVLQWRYLRGALGLQKDFLYFRLSKYNAFLWSHVLIEDILHILLVRTKPQ